MVQGKVQTAEGEGVALSSVSCAAGEAPRYRFKETDGTFDPNTGGEAGVLLQQPEVDTLLPYGWYVQTLVGAEWKSVYGGNSAPAP